MRLCRLTPLALALGIAFSPIALSKTNESGIDRKNFDTTVEAC